MKNLNYYLRLVNSKSANKSAYLSLIQREVSGGRIARQEIDRIKEYPHATEIAISGLEQSTFEYFVGNYGAQFKAIIFWKCPRIQDLRAMESLNQVEYLVYFWNQRATKLWDFSKTKALKGFCFHNFRHMHDIAEVSTSPSLEELEFGDGFWRKYILSTLQPLHSCVQLKTLSFSAKKILDEKIEPLAHLKQLEFLSFPANQFSTEQVAWLKAQLPKALESESLQPYWTIRKPRNQKGMNKDTIIVGKRKPILDSVQERDKLTKYVREFDEMYEWFLEHPKAAPPDYQKAA